MVTRPSQEFALTPRRTVFTAQPLGPFVAGAYELAFGVLLLAFMVGSLWARLDARYLIAAAFGVLAVAALSQVVGDASLADVLATYVLLLLAGGIVLLAIDEPFGRWASRRGAIVQATADTAQPSDQRNRAP
ncbi:MAG: hypothetical protein L3K17_06465 [Thermoplasmata archaeon]|nr:hypothetical protein [Thermoplasmata archaeon]